MSARTAFCLAIVALPSASAFLFPSSSPLSSLTTGAPTLSGKSACGFRVAPETRRGATVAASAATQAKADTGRELTLADVKGSNTDAVWAEVPEELYFIANYAAALGGEYPPENVDKSYWDQIKPATYTKLAALAKTADPSTISQGQYLMLMEAIVRDAIAKDPSMARPTMEEPSLTEQQEYIYNWIQSVPNDEFLKFKEEYKMENMSPAEWWGKIDEVAKENAAKGIKLPEAIVDMVEARFPKQEEESMYIGMRKVTAAEYKAYEAKQAQTGGLDPLEASRKAAKEAADKK
ncbi:hypothetical protein NSK_003001 [Nannochloropsis salina CCMP1776]|uniref:Uncharacterized protein n=1 Tax=Nannochloropsis salina CCMP1776 TaxID=1027361 RepID=A0A4D9D1A8_9STRA|nr:hypothetical protein NSK_003001 [Nannochloropsis salina CCMP1776]|eukprot:TFJ85491.1 hypothetical protein NSK_003001 [Nannochloropsis salina CCMP1776]